MTVASLKAQKRLDALLPPVFVAVVRASVWTAIGWVAILTGADADLWGSLRFGLDILHSGRPSTDDVYAFTHDKPWVNHEWLSQLAAAVAYRAVGTTGLVLLKTLLVLGTLVIVRGAFAGAAPLVAEAAAAFVLVTAIPLELSMRSQLWTFLAVAALMRVLSEPRRTRLLLLPPLFAIWANMHGGWVVGLGLLLIWACGEWWYADRLSRAAVIGIVAASLAATLVTPYGWHMWSMLGSTVRLSRPDIAEWLPTWTSAFSFTAWLAVLALDVAVIAWARPRMRWHVILLLAVLAWSSLRVLRIGALFSVASVVTLAPYIRTRIAWPAWLVSSIQEPLARADRIFATGTIACVAAFAATTAAPHVRCIPPLPSTHLDAPAVQVLRHARSPATIVVPFDWGHYTLWHLGPAIRVSIDGRRETLYSDAVLRNQQEIEAGSAEGVAALRALRPDYVWLPDANTGIRSALPALGYRVDVDTGRSFIASRSDLPALPADLGPDTGCFPDP